MPELIHNLSLQQLREVCREMGQPDWRAAQIWQWLYIRMAEDWDAMRNLPHDFRILLAARFRLAALQPDKTDTTSGQTAAKKISATLFDGDVIEAALITAPGQRSPERHTVCVSSQAGCKFHCAFCASGQSGFRRNLAPAEMVEQTLIFARRLGATPSNVVFMGIGEPLDNYDNVLQAIRILNHPDGLRIGARRITISTCGIIPGIRRLADEGLQVELSVSLHAPDDDLRSRLMPVNRSYPMAQLLDACGEYTRTTKRIITFEYTLIDKINAEETHARALAALLRGRPCRMNLIPLSAVNEFEGRPPAPAAARKFINILRQAGINSTLRASRGGGINAACGQLRLQRRREKNDVLE